jgi:hypothetical protein
MGPKAGALDCTMPERLVTVKHSSLLGPSVIEEVNKMWWIRPQGPVLIVQPILIEINQPFQQMLRLLW